MMYKICIAGMTAAMLLSCTGLTASAEELASGTCGENLTWAVENGTLTISGTGDMEDYDNYEQEFIGMQPVETLDRPWESYSDTITSIVIEDGVTSIGNFAFSDLYYVENVSWSDSLEHIGDYAFLRENDADAVTTFEDFSAALKSIGDGAFLGQDAFSWKLELPQGLESVGMAAFADSEGQTRYSVTIPESLVTIGDYAFGGTPAPYEGDGWEWLEALSDAIFYKEQPVSDFFTGIDGFTVYGNTGTAAQTYAEAHGFTFRALDAELASGTCGDSITWRYEDATLYIEGTGDMYDYDAYDDTGEGPFFVETQQTPWGEYAGYIDKVVFSDGITSIGNFAFVNLSGAKEIVFSDSITEIGDYAFAFSGIGSTENLRIAEFPANLQTIGEGAFLSCNFADENLILPDGLTTIGDVAFSDMISIEDADESNWFRSQPLSAITIPDSVTSIGEHAFGATVSATVLANGEDMEYSETLTEASASIYRKERPTASYFTDIAGFTVFGYTGSISETYAADHGFTFVALNAESETTTTETSETETTETTNDTTSASATSASETTSTTTASAAKNNASSPKTSDGGVAALALAGMTALLGGAVCRKKK